MRSPRLPFGSISDTPAEKTAPLLKDFAGVKRRQEVLGSPGGVTIIEDFAIIPQQFEKPSRPFNLSTQRPTSFPFLKRGLQHRAEMYFRRNTLTPL
jgi:hypothetical protein